MEWREEKKRKIWWDDDGSLFELAEAGWAGLIERDRLQQRKKLFAVVLHPVLLRTTATACCSAVLH